MAITVFGSDRGAPAAPPLHKQMAVVSSAAAHGAAVAVAILLSVWGTGSAPRPVANRSRVIQVIAVPPLVPEQHSRNRGHAPRPEGSVTPAVVDAGSAQSLADSFPDPGQSAVAAPEAPSVVTGTFDPPTPRTPTPPVGAVRAGGFDVGGRAPSGATPEGVVAPAGLFGPGGTGNGGGRAREGVERQAQLLERSAPEYTDAARESRISGEVLLEVRLTATGEVHVLGVLAGLGYGLDESAIAAVKRSRCRPAMKDGRPIDVIATVTVIFSLT